mmetsp:Transcript_41940/g.125437  ORF Transcript_41940/g.125437 Transcript_41940/m.125437 type:complete len:260 (-) Transcript_41940:1143-1922(-)
MLAGALAVAASPSGEARMPCRTCSGCAAGTRGSRWRWPKEGGEGALPLLFREAGVVGERLHSPRPQELRQVLAVALALAVHDAGVPVADALGHEVEKLRFRILPEGGQDVLRDDLVVQVRPVEGQNHLHGRPKVQGTRHIPAHSRGCSGGAGCQRHPLRQQGPQLPKLPVAGPEVVTPLAHAVGLVHCQQGHGGRPEAERTRKVRGGRELGRDVDHAWARQAQTLRAASPARTGRVQSGQDLLLLFGGPLRVESRGRNA